MLRKKSKNPNSTKDASSKKTSIAIVVSSGTERVNPIKMQTVRRGMIHFPPRIFGSKQK